MGTLIAERAMKFVFEKLSKDKIPKKLLNFTLNIWTNSTTVLHWLQSTTKQPTFIKNRFKDLLPVPSLICRYVNTKKTLTDIASRGCSFNKLLHNNLWWSGSLWLVTNTYLKLKLILVFESTNPSCISITCTK